jgi:transposase
LRGKDSNRRWKLLGKRGRGTLAEEKPPVLSLIQLLIFIQMFPNVQQKIIKPIIAMVVAAGSMIYTDEYDIYSRLTEWGNGHKSVNHSAEEYARDENGDGFHEVHVNTMEGFWSLLRSWLRPHQGISQEKLPCTSAFSSSSIMSVSEARPNSNSTRSWLRL